MEIADPLRLTVSTDWALLAGYFARLIDREHALGFGDVLSADAQGRFEPQTVFQGGRPTPDIHWYRFDLLCAPGAPADWTLELGEAYIDHLDLYVPDPAMSGSAAGYSLIRMGDFVPFRRSGILPTPAPAITLPAG